jgi:hypothetical protein
LSVATYAIVVSTATKAIRRVIVCDSGNVTSPNVGTVIVDGGVHAVAAGEQVIIATPGQGGDSPVQWASQVQAATGIAPPISTMALVDNTNTVQQVICGETGIDGTAVGSFTAVNCYSPLICAGCTYTSGTGLFTAPGYTIPAGVAGNVGSVTPKVVAATIIAKPT